MSNNERVGERAFGRHIEQLRGATMQIVLAELAARLSHHARGHANLIRDRRIGLKQVGDLPSNARVFAAARSRVRCHHPVSVLTIPNFS